MPENHLSVLREVLRTNNPAGAYLRWYGDASGKEDLDASNFEWHVFVFIGIDESSERFREWNSIVQREFGGHVHCGDRRRRPSVELINRTLRTDLPDWVEINVIHNRVYTAWVRSEMRAIGVPDIDGDWSSAHFWLMMLSKAFAVSNIIGRYTGTDDGLRHMSGMVLNNRADGNSEHSSEELIRQVLTPKLHGKPLAFESGENPWLGLADIYAWATRQIIVEPERRPTGFLPEALWDRVPTRRIRWHFPGWPELHRGLHPKAPNEVAISADLIEYEYRNVNRLLMPPNLLARVLRYRRNGLNIQSLAQAAGL